MSGHVIALDQGTTSSRAIIFSRDGNIVSMARYPISQHYPKPGWVEHEPEELWSTIVQALKDAFEKSGLSAKDIEAIGVTNQRETAVLWDAKTGQSVYNAIVWQCRRTASICEELTKDGLTDYIKSRTGLLVDAYFTGTKFRWILDNVAGLRGRAERGELLGGTVDSWIIWNLTGRHLTDHSNASRTMLFNIEKLCWDEDLCSALRVPERILPEPVKNSDIYGRIKPDIPGLEELAGIPVCAAAGDQQAALFGQCCFYPGMVKNTYGTGCFAVMNTGQDIVRSKAGLVSSVGWTIGDRTTYCLEGSVFNAGSAIQWLRDGLGLFSDAARSGPLAQTVPDTGGVYIVPAFTGLGAPYWDMDARGLICGITRGTTGAHITRAVLESIGYQTASLLQAMQEDTLRPISELRVDGGASASDFLMQFQADILNIEVLRPAMVETTAAGAAFLAGLAAGVWSSEADLMRQWKIDSTFVSHMDAQQRRASLEGWENAVRRALMK